MMAPSTLLILADIVLVMHTALALFLTFGLIAIWLGNWRGWAFVRGRAFRIIHLIGMAVVALESVLGVACPLTGVEFALRKAGDTTTGGAPYLGGFIAHWLGRLLYYDFDERVFAALYVAGLGLTLLAWRKVRVTGKAGVR